MNKEINLRVLELGLNDNFTAYDLNVDGSAPWPMRARHHCIQQADGPNAHDHPFGLEVYIPLNGGGYVEEIFTHFADRYISQFVERLPGTAFYVPATRIHRIEKLLAPTVWTYCITGPWEQEWQIYTREELINEQSYA